MHDCPCCGTPVCSDDVSERCTPCQTGDWEDCDPALTWHCFTGHCDGSGCSYPGECEESSDVPTPASLLAFAKTAVAAIPCDGCHNTVGTCTCGKDDRAYWEDKDA